jgi:hypothetical protein
MSDVILAIPCRFMNYMDGDVSLVAEASVFQERLLDAVGRRVGLA